MLQLIWQEHAVRASGACCGTRRAGFSLLPAVPPCLSCLPLVLWQRLLLTAHQREGPLCMLLMHFAKKRTFKPNWLTLH